MPNNRSHTPKPAPRRTVGTFAAAGTFMLCAVLALQGCFDPVYPQVDREARIMEALTARDHREGPPSPLSPAGAVVYGLANSLEARVSEIEIAYQNEAAIAARRRLLPSLNLRYAAEHANHPSARWSQSTRSGNQSLESSFSSDPNSRQAEVGLLWNVMDFGVGYLRARQQGERNRQSELQRRRVRQQIVLDVLSHYWRASAALSIAAEAEALRRELDEQAESIRDSVAMRILSGAEGARRELAVQGGLAEMDQWRRAATGAKLELARVLGCGSATEFDLEPFPADPAEAPHPALRDPLSLQTAALRRRPELYQHDSQERIAVDEARLALLQMAPNANLSFNLNDDPDKYLEWNNWMAVGARVSWNLFNIPARVSERRMAKLQGEIARRKGLALAAAVMAQVGIAYSDWRLAQGFADSLVRRSEARERLVEALAAGEKDGQTRPGEVLQERVRLLSEKAAALRAAAEARIAAARLANAVGLDIDDQGNLVWEYEGADRDLPVGRQVPGRHDIVRADDDARTMLPATVSGLRVIDAAAFLVSGYAAEDQRGDAGRTGEDSGFGPGPIVPEEDMPDGTSQSVVASTPEREARRSPPVPIPEPDMTRVFATPPELLDDGEDGEGWVEELGYVDGSEGWDGPAPAEPDQSGTGDGLLRPSRAADSPEDIWQGVSQSFAKASPAALVPRGVVREAEPGTAPVAPASVPPAGSPLRPSGDFGLVPDRSAGPEEIQSLAPPPEHGPKASAALPKNLFRRPSSPSPAATAGVSLRPADEPEDTPVQQTRPRSERERALEPLQAIPKKRQTLRPPI